MIRLNAVVLLVFECLLLTLVFSRHRRESLGDLDQFPNPTNDFEKCGRKAKSFICDPELYIKPKVSDYLDELIINATKSDMVWCPRKERKEGEEEGTKYGTISGIDRSNFELRGMQIGVTIISSFKNYDHNVPVAASYNDYEYLSKKYAKSIHTQWGIGDSDCNNGIMIFIAIDDRVLYISTGKGVKDIITDQFIDNFIMNKIRSYMRNEQYGDAVVRMLDIIFEMVFYQDDRESSDIYKEWDRLKKKRSNDDSGTLFSIFGLFDVSFEDCLIGTIVVGFITYIYYKSKRNAEYRECQNRLASIYAQSQQRRFNQESCPICLEEFGTGNSSNRATSLLACGHKFCTQCLDEWFSGQMRNQHRCPVCRQHRDDLSNIPQNGDNINSNNTDTDTSNNENDVNTDTVRSNESNQNTSNSSNSDTNDLNNTNEFKDSNEYKNENDNKNDNENDARRRNDYRRNRSDFTDNFPNVDKTNEHVSGSTFYGSNSGPQGTDRQETQTNSNQENQYNYNERNRNENGFGNRFFRRYAAMNMANNLMYQNDINFRLRRMRHFYPRYIDDRMVNRWTNPTYQGGNFAHDTSFTANNPTPPQPPSSSSGSSRASSWGRRSSGSGSGGFSFGGGSSFGGGGGGGRW